MTRKDFELIARTVKSFNDAQTRDVLAAKFAKELSGTNANFDPTRFAKACGVNVPKGEIFTF